MDDLRYIYWCLEDMNFLAGTVASLVDLRTLPVSIVVVWMAVLQICQPLSIFQLTAT
jgi:hypothetical protein